MKFDPPHPTHFSSGTRRDRSPLHPAAIMAMNATVCSLPLAMQMHARDSREVSLSINVALIMPKTYQSHGRNYLFFLQRKFSIKSLLVIGDYGSEHGKNLVCIKDTYLLSMKAAIVSVRVMSESKHDTAACYRQLSSDTRKSQRTSTQQSY